MHPPKISTTLPLALTVFAALIPPAVSAPAPVAADISSALRISTPSDLPDLLTARVAETIPPDAANMGFVHPNFLGTTAHNRLVLAPPRYHNLAYVIPSAHSAHSEYLVADHEDGGSLQSFGWQQTHRTGSSRTRDIAIKLGEARYLLADNVPVSGFVTTRAPWMQQGGDKRDWMVLGEKWPSPVLQSHTGGEVSGLGAPRSEWDKRLGSSSSR